MCQLYTNAAMHAAKMTCLKMSVFVNKILFLKEKCIYPPGSCYYDQTPFAVTSFLCLCLLTIIAHTVFSALDTMVVTVLETEKPCQERYVLENK